MTAPSPPYTTATAVAYLLRVLLSPATEFATDTTPTLAAVNQMITWISNQVDMQFGQAGYVIPLATLSGETWPTAQTTYLQYITTIGTAAMAGGWAQKPAPALAPGQKSGTGNIWQDLFDKELWDIYDYRNGTTRLRFRAQYYTGTPAQEILTDPRGPTTDFLEEKFDPMRHYSLWEMSNKMIAIEKSMQALDISWDYMFSLFDIDKGFGTSVYE